MNHHGNVSKSRLSVALARGEVESGRGEGKAQKCKIVAKCATKLSAAAAEKIFRKLFCHTWSCSLDEVVKFFLPVYTFLFPEARAETWWMHAERMREREVKRSRQRELLSCNQKAQKAKPKERTKNWSVALIKVSNKSKGATPTLQLMQYLAHCATLWQYYSSCRGWEGERGDGSFGTKNLAQSAQLFFFYLLGLLCCGKCAAKLRNATFYAATPTLQGR